MREYSASGAWLWQLAQVRDHLDLMLPTNGVLCSLAITGAPMVRDLESIGQANHKKSELFDPSYVPGTYSYSTLEPLPGFQLSEGGLIEVENDPRAAACILQNLTSNCDALRTRNCWRVSRAIADLVRSVPLPFRKIFPWLKGIDGCRQFLFYSYLYEVHPLLLATDSFIKNSDDAGWPTVSASFRGIIPPVLVLDFEYDWRSLIGFALEGMHRLGKAEMTRLQENARPTKEMTSGSDGVQSNFSIAALCDMTGLGNATLHKYTRAAKVPTARVGQRNHRFTTAQIRRILRTIIATSSVERTRHRCRKSLENLEDKK